jgi:hypothetical protein
MWYTAETNLEITEYSQIAKNDSDCSSLFSKTNELTQAPFGYGQDFFLVYKTPVGNKNKTKKKYLSYK